MNQRRMLAEGDDWSATFADNILYISVQQWGFRCEASIHVADLVRKRMFEAPQWIEPHIWGARLTESRIIPLGYTVLAEMVDFYSAPADEWALWELDSITGVGAEVRKPLESALKLLGKRLSASQAAAFRRAARSLVMGNRDEAIRIIREAHGAEPWETDGGFNELPRDRAIR